MKDFLSKNRTGALMTIVILAIGSIAGIGFGQFVTASQIGKLCIIFACGNATINGGTSGGGGGQPTPNTAKLIVTKLVAIGLFCPPGSTTQCKPSDFQITVSGVTASPSTFKGDSVGTTVIVSPGTYTISENTPAGQVSPGFSGDCQKTNNFQAKGTISAGQTQTCTITNGSPPP